MHIMFSECKKGQFRVKSEFYKKIGVGYWTLIGGQNSLLPAAPAPAISSFIFLWLSGFVHHEMMDGGFLTLVPIVYEMLTCRCSCPLNMAHKFFCFLLWLLVYLRLSVKGIMVSLVCCERARHYVFPYSSFISIIRLPCKSHS